MNRKYLFAITLFVAPIAARASADELDAKLAAVAPKVLDYLKAKKCETVGVLKFLVDKGDGKLMDNAGTLNQGIADRLEVALILALKTDDMSVIYRASDGATTIAGANHLTLAGRKAFFNKQYPWAWGPPDDKAKPSVLLTGEVVVSKDLKQTTVTIQAFGPDGAMVTIPDAKVSVETPLRVLVDSGRSYLITEKTHKDVFSRGFKKEDVKNTVVEQNIALDSGSQPPMPKPSVPSFDADAPIRVSVLIAGRAVQVQNGAVREPKVDEKVELLLENMTDDVYGVVLKINGENTIFREKFDAKDCYKWILKKKEKNYVTGFQETNDKWNEFRVLPYEESKANEVNYGPVMGTIQVTAFRGKLVDAKSKPPVTQPVKKEELVVAAISRGAIQYNEDGNPAGIRPQTLGALKGKLQSREQVTTGSKGLLGIGNQTEHPVNKVVFEADPAEAVMNYSIRYYRPKN
jgi:hypothetical protein